MRWKDLFNGTGSLLERAGVGKATLKLSAGFAEVELEANPTDADADAAWALYVELATRVTTQALQTEPGDERAALKSVHSLFDLTRGVLKMPGGRKARRFARVAINVLNEVIRPFTTPWHRRALAGELDTPAGQQAFHADLAQLQLALNHYANLLAEIAGVPPLAELGQD